MMNENINYRSKAVPELMNVHLDERQPSRRWGMSVKTLQNRRVTGGFVAFIKIGGSVRYRLLDIEIFEAEHLRFSTSDGAEA